MELGSTSNPTSLSWQLSRAMAGGCIPRCSGAPWMVNVCSARARRIRCSSAPCDREAISSRPIKCRSSPSSARAHSSLLDRMLGTVDVRGDLEVLMLYTSYAGPPGAAIIWKLGPDAQSIAICCTDGDPAANPAVLDWSRFSRDLIVASHFTHVIGVYNLEGCVRQGFLPRLKAMDWSQSVTIPADAVRRADHRVLMLVLVLWISSHLLYLVVALVLAIAWIVWRRRKRKMTDWAAGICVKDPRARIETWGTHHRIQEVPMGTKGPVTFKCPRRLAAAIDSCITNVLYCLCCSEVNYPTAGQSGRVAAQAGACRHTVGTRTYSGGSGPGSGCRSA